MCTVAPTQFIELITSFRQRYPNVILQIIDDNARQLQTALLAGDLEAAIYCLPGEPPHERTHVMPLFKEQMVIAVCRGHALSRKKVLKGVDLNGEAYLDRINCEFTGYADRLFSERSIDGPTVYQSERDDWILAMIAAGMGYGFLPRSSAEYPGVVFRPVVEPEFWRTVNLVTVRGRRHSPAVGALVREVMRTKWQGQKALALGQARTAELHTSIGSAHAEKSKCRDYILPALRLGLARGLDGAGASVDVCRRARLGDARPRYDRRSVRGSRRG